MGNFLLLQLAGQVTQVPPLPPTFTAHLHKNNNVARLFDSNIPVNISQKASSGKCVLLNAQNGQGPILPWNQPLIQPVQFEHTSEKVIVGQSCLVPFSKTVRADSMLQCTSYYRTLYASLYGIFLGEGKSLRKKRCRYSVTKPCYNLSKSPK